VSRLRGDEAVLYERYGRRLERSVAQAPGADRGHAEDACAFAWAHHRCWVPPVRAPEQDSHLRSQRHAQHTRARCAGLIRPAADLACGPLHPPDSHSRWTEERGPPIAATKTFTAQITLLCLLALHLAEGRETLSEADRNELLDEICTLPGKVSAYLDGYSPVDDIAERHYDKPFFLYLGRGVGLPTCLEGALKLKEISYIPTDAYAAGEMKHGPIALLNEETPVVCVATDSPVYCKLVSNIQAGGPGHRDRD